MTTVSSFQGRVRVYLGIFPHPVAVPFIQGWWLVGTGELSQADKARTSPKGPCRRSWKIHEGRENNIAMFFFGGGLPEFIPGGFPKNGGFPQQPMGFVLLKMIMTWGVKWGVPPFKETPTCTSAV